MDSIYRLKNRGAICFLLLLLGCCQCFALDWRDNRTWYSQITDNPPLTVDIWDGSSWRAMNTVYLYSDWARYNDSKITPDPIYFRRNFSDGSSSVLEIPNSDGNSFFSLGSNGVITTYKSWNDYSNRQFLSTSDYVIRSGSYQPPCLPDLGFTLSAFIDLMIIALGVTLGIVVGGILLFMYIRKGLQHMRGLG